MKDFRRLKHFPLGTVRAEGFLREQLLRGKEGMAGHLFELEPGMIADPYLRRTRVPVWSEAHQVGWGAEISGNYWAGYIQHAFVLDDAEMIARATEWVDDMLKMAKPDGYLGAYFKEGDAMNEDYNAQGTACAMRGLLAFYEATGRADVLEAVHNCMLWFCREWAGDNKTCYAGQLIVEPMILCYRYTGDERLVEFAVDYERYLCEHDIFRQSYRVLMSDEYYYNSNHTAGMGLNLRLPALIYSANGERDYLTASERCIEKIRARSGHVGGAPVSVNEYLAPVSGTAEIEYCSFAYYNLSYSYMSAITGEAKYGDYMEELFYNAAQGARKKDEKAIAYLSAPNQLLATDTSANSTDGNMQVYAPCYPVSCCPVNSVAVVPEFVRGLFLHDDAGNLYANAYGPCSLHWGDRRVTERTLYPFRNRVALEIEGDGEFSVFLKIPAWATGYRVFVDGAEICAQRSALGYAEVRRDFGGKHCLEICFDAKVEVVHVDDRDASNKQPLAFRYGALVFSLQVPERWKPIAGKPVTPLPEGWSWYNVYPDYKQPDTGDYYENVGRRRDAFNWNVALDEALTAAEVTVEEVEGEGYVWEQPRILLHTHCYKAPYACCTYPRKTYEPFGDRQHVTERLPLTLVPYGCTNLRVTYFPRADLDENK